MDIRWYLKKMLLNSFSPSEELASDGHVCMVHIGRCGSTVLSNMIEQSFSIHWAGELYEPIFKAFGTNLGQFKQCPIDFLKGDMASAKKARYGFEFKPYHLQLLGQDPSAFLNTLVELGFTKFIFLDRANRLRKIVSSLKAKSTGVYHVSPGYIRRNPRGKIYVNINQVEIDHDSKTLLEYLVDYDRDVSLYLELLGSKNPLILEYSRHIQNDPYVGYQYVSRFLDLPHGIKPKIYYNRTNPFGLESIIENYQDVIDLLKPTKYAWMLEQDIG